MRSLAFFSGKGGVGKTTLTFNIAHMLARLGQRVVVLDYDPECALSEFFLGYEELFEIWEGEKSEQWSARTARTVAGCVALMRSSTGVVLEPRLVEAATGIWLLPGHLDLVRFEQTLAEDWRRKSREGLDTVRSLDVVTALGVLANKAAAQVSADVVLIDVGPGLRVLNRAALLACDAIVFPLALDLFSLQGLASVGPILREWREDWVDISHTFLDDVRWRSLPIRQFQPIGYIVNQPRVFAGRMLRVDAQWVDRIPTAYHQSILGEPSPAPGLTVNEDEQCLATINNAWSLASMAQTAGKPIFELKQADGVGGAQLRVVARVRAEFETLAHRVLARLEHLPEARPVSA